MTENDLPAEQGRARPLQRFIHVAGYLVVALAFVYIFRALMAYRETLFAWRPGTGQLLLLIFAGCAYGMGGFLLSSAWCRLNKICGQQTIPAAQCTRIYGTTQIAKYLPGNIFHFVGRHAAGVRAGLAHATLACSASLEMIGLLFAAGLLGLLAVLLLGPTFLAGLSLGVKEIAALVVGCFVVLVIVLPRISARLRARYGPEVGKMAAGGSLVPVIARYLGFFLLCCLLMVAVAAAVLENLATMPLALVFASYPIAWLAGYVIPGASAGIGVREASMMIMLSLSVAPEQAFLIALLMRAVTVFGDLVFYILASLAGRSAKQSV